ncbi:zinc finger DHHC-type containing 4 L homeolog isoform X1 [Xenopus laevis]|uniref:Palmitoyltransferase n=2 Tax=Xenopus laevis TaxID=8355 RepID=Q6GN07_XENLA|nr:zinc finger DHHC-type containing 4 L homeolog [Xenopus laevis]XP_018089855.1 zinc finger DHHC-type containing 4 L homeolog isoform X1 [Xenopus laevis]AAH73715.1 MGC83658 protein [Xenopus laevis]OCT64382.1 hypothetical protein XELAEV_18045486mg [Xenopus laevis]
MDFLWLFITYVTFLVVCIFAFCFLSERSRNGLDRVLHRADTVLSLVLPTWLQRRYKSSFQTRNGAFVILHLILDILVFAEYSWEVLGYCLELEMNWPFIFLPYACISVNLYFFYRCCAADPGIVNRKNEASYVQLYEYDSILFHPENQCPTCQLTKPARSKHCSVCGCCVHRFDHHCVWVNNCIGGLNMRYFLIYLISLTLTALSLAAVITAFLLKVVLLSHMMSATFIDPDGLEQLVNMVFIIQHLFMTFPRIVFTLGFLCVLVLLLGVYSAFMLYLGLTNQTTNEWHKLKGRSLAAGSRKGYSKGILGNILEIFQPRTCHKKDR